MDSSVHAVPRGQPSCCGQHGEPQMGPSLSAPVAPEAAELLEQLFPSWGPLLEINK